jgi:hypothetical protein
MILISIKLIVLMQGKTQGAKELYKKKGPMR